MAGGRIIPDRASAPVGCLGLIARGLLDGFGIFQRQPELPTLGKKVTQHGCDRGADPLSQLICGTKQRGLDQRWQFAAQLPIHEVKEVYGRRWTGWRSNRLLRFRWVHRQRHDLGEDWQVVFVSLGSGRARNGIARVG